MNRSFPSLCSRCGFCCLIERCPISKSAYDPENNSTCRFLSFEEDVASCFLAKIMGHKELGIGAGCCIKATVVIRGIGHPFCDLPPDQKIMATRLTRIGKVRVVKRGKGGENRALCDREGDKRESV